MAAADDKIEKFVNILVEMKGADEVQRDLERMYEAAKKGANESAKSADEAEPRVSKFLERWKTQALTLGAALAALWGLSKYSSVASGLVSMFGASLGLLADVILQDLVDPMNWLSEIIIDIADAFDGLPEPLRKIISYLTGLGIAIGILKKTGVLAFLSTLAARLLALGGVVVGEAGFIAALEAAMAAGGTAAAVAWGATFLAGIALGLAGVAILFHSGALDWIDKAGRAFEQKFPWFQDILKTLWAPAGVLGVIAIDLVSGRIGEIPADVKRVLGESYDALKRTIDRILTIFGPVIDAIQVQWTVMWNYVKTTAITTFTGLASSIRNTIQSVVNWISGLNPFSGWKLPSLSSLTSSFTLPFFAAGGHYVEEGGLAMLHKGEYITSSFRAQVREAPDERNELTRGGGGISIGQVVLQGKFEDEHQMYRKFITLLEREGRRVV